ncbi:hypothetical protein ACFLTP_03860 [Chloroflexota bacterium]
MIRVTAVPVPTPAILTTAAIIIALKGKETLLPIAGAMALTVCLKLLTTIKPTAKTIIRISK